MATLVLEMDDEVVERARKAALRDGISLDTFVQRRLEQLAVAQTDAEGGMRAFLQQAERLSATSPLGGRRWTRDDLYER